MYIEEISIVTCWREQLRPWEFLWRYS